MFAALEPSELYGAVAIDSVSSEPARVRRIPLNDFRDNSRDLENFVPCHSIAINHNSGVMHAYMYNLGRLWCCFVP